MKKILIFLFSFFIFIPSIMALPTTYNREELDNLGVNKKWEITSNNKSNVLNTYKVDASEKIYDFSEVLTTDEINILKTKIDEYISHTGFDLVIVTDSLAYSYDSANDTYATDFYDYNDFGIDDEHYSGVLLFRNTYSVDPYYDYYMFGDAQFYYHSDTGRNDYILDGIYNNLHSGNYLEGFSQFVDYLTRYYDEGIPSIMTDRYELDSNFYMSKKYQLPVFFATVVSLIITIIVMSILKSKNKTIIKKIDANDYVDKSGVNIKEKQDNYVTTHVTRVYIAPSSSSGGGSSSHGSSGGGFSSGGGRHG